LQGGSAVQISGDTDVDSLVLPPSAGPLLVTAEWPVRCGNVPPLADRFSTRPETAPDLTLALERSAAVALMPRPRRLGAGSSHDWLRCSGKTQLAAFYAESQWRRRAFDLVVWIDASSTASILSAYVTTVQALTGMRMPGIAESVAASFLTWLRETDRRWLIVLDDVPNSSVLQGLWPAGPAGRVVLTTPSAQATVGLQDVLTLELGPFSKREAMSYLAGRLSSDPDQRRGAIELIDDLDCQPMALAQATATIASSWMTCADYRDQLYLRSSVISSPGTAPLPAAGVTWTLCADHSDQLMPGGSAQSCLAIAALLDGHGVPATVFAAPAACSYITGSTAATPQDLERAQTALDVLEQSGLIGLDRGSEPAIVRMNPILQRAVRAAMSPEMLEQAASAAAAALLESWPSPEPGGGLSQSLRASAGCLRRATGGLLWADGCHKLLLRAGQSLDEASLTGPAVDYWAELTATGNQMFGPGHRESLLTVERLAAAFVAARRVSEAIAWYQRVIAEWGKACGPDHPRTLAARVRLGRVLVTAGLFDEAISVLTAALSDAERAHGPAHPECAIIRDEVAAGHRAAGELGEAIRLYRLILGDRERSLGAEHPDTIAARQLLAEAYLADGRLKDAFTQSKKAVADRQRSQGADHPDTLRAGAQLAAAYHSAGRMALAVQLSEQVHAGLQRVHGSDHTETISAALSLGRVYYAVGRLSDARRVLEDAVAHGERVLAPADPITRNARESLAAIVGTQAPGRPTRATRRSSRSTYCSGGRRWR
jgi:tetratricopeptide (TPR) repeat protein